MALSIGDVEHVALLSRLALTDGEKEKFARELSKIFSHVDQLAELNVEGVEPTAHPLPMKNVFRQDVVLDSLSNEAVLANAAESEDGCFKVPQIV
ncbi:Asp-tRNA(Asn)/Glu-tRNA(Gln) amidotransferase subunit GatC [bacterium]|nr:Asp-tRNA(Asn)/Glu-tRNA(Gln) amidotransferase subunit GatC [bacterium]